MSNGCQPASKASIFERGLPSALQDDCFCFCNSLVARTVVATTAPIIAPTFSVQYRQSDELRGANVMDARHLQNKTRLKPANPCVLRRIFCGKAPSRWQLGDLWCAKTAHAFDAAFEQTIAKAVARINASRLTRACRAKLQTKDDCALVAELLRHMRHLPDEVFSLVLVLTNSILNIQATSESPGRKTHIAMLPKQCKCVPRGTGEKKTLHTKIVFRMFVLKKGISDIWIRMASIKGELPTSTAYSSSTTPSQGQEFGYIRKLCPNHHLLPNHGRPWGCGCSQVLLVCKNLTIGFPTLLENNCASRIPHTRWDCRLLS